MSTYPVTLEFPVAWGDMDALGHVNNIRYFAYFESARIAYFERLGLRVALDSAEGSPILASTSCDFLFPLSYPDRVRAEASIVKVGRSSATMAYRVVSLTYGQEAARGQGVIVWFDYGARQSMPIPDHLRARIGEIEGAGGQAFE